MAKIDLKKISGFPLVLDSEQLITEGVAFETTVKLTVEKMRMQLLNEELTSPEVFYTKHLKLDEDRIYAKKKLRINTYLIPPNQAGVEYVKTKATKTKDFPTILEIANGSGAIMMQDSKTMEDQDIIMTRAKRGDKIVIPPNYSFTIINIKPSTLVVTEILNKDAIQSYTLDEMGGLAYYVIKKNAQLEIVKNPIYKSTQPIRKVNWNEICLQRFITLKTPIIKQILRKYDKFEWLYQKDSFVL